MGGMREYTEKRMLRLAGLLTEAAGDDLSPEMGPMAQPPMMQQVGAGEEAQGPEWEAFKAAVDAYNDQMTAELDLLRDIAIVPDPGAYWSAGIRTFDEFREELAREAEHEAAKDLIRRVADEAEEGAGAAEMHYDPADMYDVDPYGRSGNLPMWQESRSSGRPLKERVYTIDLKSLLAEGGPPPIPAAAMKKPDDEVFKDPETGRVVYIPKKKEDIEARIKLWRERLNNPKEKPIAWDTIRILQNRLDKLSGVEHPFAI